MSSIIHYISNEDVGSLILMKQKKVFDAIIIDDRGRMNRNGITYKQILNSFLKSKGKLSDKYADSLYGFSV